MGIGYNPRIVTDGLVLCLDAANRKSYPGSGTTWTDLSGNGRNATKGGSQSPTYPLWNSSGYFEFTGGINGNNYSRFTVTTPAVNELTVFTFHYSTQAGGHILRHTNDDFQIGPDGYTAGTSYNDISSSRPDTLNTWISDALTFDGRVLTGYRNGSQQSTNTRSLYTSIAGGTLNIGSRSDNFAAHYVGRIALVMMYDRPLSAEEIRNNFNALRGRFGV